MPKKKLTHQGILLGSDVEVFLISNKEFVIGDLEAARIWKTHYLDTTDAIKAINRLYTYIMRQIKQARIQKIKQREKKRQLQWALDQAQPSDPRRLAAE